MKVNKLVSIHFPKAGGSSLRTQFSELLGASLHLDYEHDPLGRNGGEIAPFPANKIAVHGHFRAIRYESCDTFIITFLRDPINTLLSIYFYWKKLPDHGNLHSRFLREQPDILLFAKYPGVNCLMSTTYFGGFDVGRFDFVGFHDRRVHDIERLGRALGLPLQSSVHENKTEESEERGNLESSAKTISQLRDILIQDVVFYERLRFRWGWPTARQTI